MYRTFSYTAAVLLAVSCCTLSVAQETRTARKVTAEVEEPAVDHPLLPVIKFARSRLEYYEQNIKDYTCTLTKRERVKDQLGEYEYVDVKIRHAQQDAAGNTVTPFSAYCKFLAPADVKDREVLYVEGRNGGRVLARRGGTRLAFIVTSLDPRGDLAMRGNRYPMTEIGFKKLVERLIEAGEQELQYGECSVNYFKDAKVNDRPCTHIRVMHPVQREYFRFYQADIFIDNELQVPVRFVTYGWPAPGASDPPLLEEYTYSNVKLNVGLTDADFDAANPAYGFNTRISDETAKQ